MRTWLASRPRAPCALLRIFIGAFLPHCLPVRSTATLFKVSDASMALEPEETFGPVFTLQAFHADEEVIALANHSQYGRPAAVWTHDIDQPFRGGRKIAACTIWINDGAAVFDDFNSRLMQSGLGRLNGMAVIDDFMECKHIAWIDS